MPPPLPDDDTMLKGLGLLIGIGFVGGALLLALAIAFSEP